ncbi:MAG TPA: WhiB family transcriptional regulator [Acidimicrobiales bacterium]|nr:WhiB family transcriptional regulator [Acidimicrobiales bacterium]
MPRSNERPRSGWDLSEVLPDRPAWHELAACRGVGPDAFFPATDDRWPRSQRRYQFARSYCDHCPVVNDCLAAGETEDFGPWGGLSPIERGRRGRRAG